MRSFAILPVVAAWLFAGVDINSASKQELMSVKHIGGKKADSIIEYRTKKCFENLAELKNVNGFGAKTIESLSEHLEAKPCKDKPNSQRIQK